MRPGRFVALATAAVVATGLLVGGVSTAAPATAAPAVAPATAPKVAADPDDAAAAQARATGRPVEVSSRRTVTERVFARPDGAMAAEVSLAPVRVRRADGAWAPVDTRLQRIATGRFAPAAAVADVTLSAGGSTPAVTLTRGPASLSMSWPAPLPAPRIDGDAATYPDVLPGVDLRLRVDAEGFDEQLVVKTAQAAANPALRTIRFGLATTGGLAVRTNADGWLVATGSAGGTVFRSPPPTMWDTAADPAAVAAGLPGRHRAPVGVRITDGALELIPDPAVLTAPDLTYPLVIDPSWTTKGPAWTEVNSFSPDSATWRTVPTSLAVGYQNYQPPTRVRSFIRFPVNSTIYGSQVRSATLRLYENWASSCTKTAMEVWSTGSFGSSTTWNRQPAWVTHLDNAVDARGYSASCPAANLEFSVKAGVAAAAAARGSVTFGLKAGNENDPLGWKKFQIDGTTPQLTIVYNRAPRTPTAADLTTSNPTTSCGGTVQVNAQNGVLLKVRASDPDGDKVRVAFSFTHVGGSTASFLSPAISSGGTASWQVGAFAEGHSYSWRAHVRDVDGAGTVMSSGGWSPTCTMLQNGSRPNPPQVTSTAYPSNEYGGLPGRTGSFALAPGSSTDTDVVGYLYGLDQASPTTPVSGRTATVTATPPTWGPHDLVVQAKDTAGNLSSPMSYHFYVSSPTGAVGHWNFDDIASGSSTGIVETDPEQPGPLATLSGGAGPTAGRLDGGLRLDGTTGSASTPVRVDTTGDLTVSAWVKLSAKGRTMTIVSQDGGSVSGFQLQYRGDLDRFAFAMPRQDGTGTVDAAVGTSAVPLNTWTHVAGVHRRDDQKIGIWVNGTSEATAVHATASAWDAAGTVQVGRAKAAGAAAEFWAGDADEVRVYDRDLADSEVADLVSYTKPEPVAIWRMDDGGSSPTAADTSGRGHPLTKNAGNNFTGAGYDVGCMTFSGANAASAAAVVNTAGSFSVSAWVRLSSTSATVTALSQVGGTGARFALAYLSTGKWVFNTTSADSGTATVWGAVGTSTPVANRWTFLAATWNVADGKARLWVDGRLEATATAPGSWNASSAFLVGGSRASGQSANRWTGAIDEVRVHDRVLYAGEAADLYREGRNLASAAAPDGRWPLDEQAGATVANDASGRNRPMALSGTARFDPTGGRTRPTANGALLLDGAGSAATTYPGTRTDRSFAVSAWVRLAENDREQAVVSQDGLAAGQAGINTSAFSLSWVPDDGGTWRFSLPASEDRDAVASAPAQVLASADPVGAWVQLIAEYDSFTHVTRLTVRDDFQPVTHFGRHDKPWPGTGPLRVGRDRAVALDAAGEPSSVSDGDYLLGSIDEVTLFTGSLSAGDRTALLQ